LQKKILRQVQKILSRKADEKNKAPKQSKQEEVQSIPFSASCLAHLPGVHEKVHEPNNNNNNNA
jgi:hypothetical protein